MTHVDSLVSVMFLTYYHWLQMIFLVYKFWYFQNFSILLYTTHFSPILPTFPPDFSYIFHIMWVSVEWEVCLYQSYYSWFSFLAESLGLLVYSYLFIWFQSSVSPMKNEKRKQFVSVEILGGPTKFLLRGDLAIKGGPKF